ncbi:helix-turn-helix domain-containing protein [Synechococcus sp. RedBA-s]|uniref:helix-turn-helix domain-containing protein n=1 Tax=Synechococcus sp. RedBA-s TaxID=2823741 RepID=UPI0020CCF83A|nr:AraC family transcriptional regulator [Synechococcus sp. RedBA-s]MCP9799699.1 helix-turn-helix transcriptional regulator [Synechococcus sp. RedBA-s]
MKKSVSLTVASADVHQVFDAHQQAVDLANPFKRRLGLVGDINASAELFRRVLPVSRLKAMDPDRTWWHYGIASRIGSIVLGTWILPPVQIVVAEQYGLSVFLGYAGEQEIQQGSQHWSCCSNTCLILPGKPLSIETSLFSGLAFHLDTQHLLKTATGMAGLSQTPDSWVKSVHETPGWEPSREPGLATLQAMLRQVIAMAELQAGSSQSLLERLQLDDLIYRLLAAMIFPELREESSFERLIHRIEAGRDSFDELLDFIKSNLAEPLNLTQLEMQSHYSRRALQYTFRERLGCTPLQWIRNQRLDVARRKLQNPSPGDSVASISSDCGYRTQSLFSVDFQQRFHIRPSQLLREARASSRAR